MFLGFAPGFLSGKRLEPEKRSKDEPKMDKDLEAAKDNEEDKTDVDQSGTDSDGTSSMNSNDRAMLDDHGWAMLDCHGKAMLDIHENKKQRLKTGNLLFFGQKAQTLTRKQFPLGHRGTWG